MCKTTIQLLLAFVSVISTFNSLGVVGWQIRNQYESKEPLILTDLIRQGLVNEARSQAKVNLPGFPDLESYSGFFTVNDTCNSNLYFWYFPAERDPENAPVILWLEGGPGSSSLLSTVWENGPIHLTESGETFRANYSWSLNHHLIYIDNPVDVGFSFTDSIDCIPTEQTRVGKELYEALVQFFTVFPNLQKNGFYLSGESFAGHYVPAAAHTIHKNNLQAKLKINLKGCAIGDGAFDNLHQHSYSPFLYQIGLVDEDGRKILEEKEQEITDALNSGDLDLASDLQYSMLWNGNGTSLFTNLTGIKSYFNYVTELNLMDGLAPALLDYFNRPDIKNALHCGDLLYNIGSVNASLLLRVDAFRSVAPWVKELLENNYRILLYNGQLDIVDGYAMVREFVNQFEFNGKSEFKAAKRYIWQVDQDVAGYVREGGNLGLALVRNAGHTVAIDQPKHLLELLVGFTYPECVEFKENRRMLTEDCKNKYF